MASAAPFRAQPRDARLKALLALAARLAPTAGPRPLTSATPAK